MNSVMPTNKFKLLNNIENLEDNMKQFSKKRLLPLYCLPTK